MALKEPDVNNPRCQPGLRRGLFTLCHYRGRDMCIKRKPWECGMGGLGGNLEWIIPVINISFSMKYIINRIFRQSIFKPESWNN